MENLIMTATWQITGVTLVLIALVCIGLNMYEIVPVEEETPKTQHNSMTFTGSQKKHHNSNTNTYQGDDNR